MVKWAWSTGTDRTASLNRLEATSTGAGPKLPPIWPMSSTQQSDPMRALGALRARHRRHDPTASVRTTVTHGFWPRYGFPHPRAPPTASSRPVTLIPSPLWPIDEAKSLSSSFPHSLALTCSSALLAVAATDEPPRQASPEPPRHLLLRRPARCPVIELSAAKQLPGVRQCHRRPPLWAPHRGQAAPVHLRPCRCILGLPPHRAHLADISNRANRRLMDPSAAPPSGRSCAAVINHIGWDSSSTGDQIEFHAPPVCPSPWPLPHLTGGMLKSAVPSPMVCVSVPKNWFSPAPAGHPIGLGQNRGKVGPSAPEPSRAVKANPWCTIPFFFLANTFE
jgi:hypothetical protein